MGDFGQREGESAEAWYFRLDGLYATCPDEDKGQLVYRRGVAKAAWEAGNRARAAQVKAAEAGATAKARAMDEARAAYLKLTAGQRREFREWIDTAAV
jgi:hypothetical protein